MDKKEFIDISGQSGYDPEGFLDAIQDAYKLIMDILCVAENCNNISASEVAKRSYVLSWLINDVEIR